MSVMSASGCVQRMGQRTGIDPFLSGERGLGQTLACGGRCGEVLHANLPAPQEQTAGKPVGRNRKSSMNPSQRTMKCAGACGEMLSKKE